MQSLPHLGTWEDQNEARHEIDWSIDRQEVHGTSKSLGSLKRLADEQAKDYSAGFSNPASLSMQFAADNFDPGPLEQTLSTEDFASFADEAKESPKNFALRVNPVTGEKEMFIYGTPSPFAINKQKGYKETWIENLRDSVIFGQNYVMNKAAPGVKHHLGEAFVMKGRVPEEVYLANIAKANDVDVIYGYSRGGAIASDLKNYGYKGAVVGLDAAMLITPNKDIINFTEGPSTEDYKAPQQLSDYGPKMVPSVYNPYVAGAVVVESSKPPGEVLHDFSETFDKGLGISGQHNIQLDENDRSPHQVWAGHKQPHTQLYNNFLAGYGLGENYDDPDYDPNSGLMYNINVLDYFNNDD